MAEATCKTCPFWLPHRRQKPLGGESVDDGPSDLGHCHHATAAANEEDPMRSETWWCSEHPLRQRDRLAAMAMQALLAAELRGASSDLIAPRAYEIADAMLAARKEERRAASSTG